MDATVEYYQVKIFRMGQRLMYIFFLVLSAVCGLIFGSFINVCIYRIPLGQSIIKPPSHCIKCNTRLGPRDLVPVFSYIFNRGRCRYCKEAISPRYTFIELLTAAVYVLLYMKYSISVEFFASIFLMSVLTVVFFIDTDHRIIPDGLVLTALAAGIALTLYNIFRPVEFYMDRKWWNPLAGVAAGSGVLFLVFLLGVLIYRSDDAMGMGDVKIFAPVGLFLGWRLTLTALFLCIFMAAVTSLFLIVLKLKDRKGTIPFGPFIVTGTFIALMWGDAIVSWYLNP